MITRHRRTRTDIFFAAVLALVLLAPMPLRAERVFETGTRRVALLELYTSEGCSSCPPADRWLGALQDHGGLWTEFVPVAFHVDYWDYIGWKDRFAQRRFTERQQEYRLEGAVKVVYTPGLMLNGAEWRRWRRGASPVPVEPRQAGRLRTVVAGDEVQVKFVPAAELTGELRVHVAWLGFELESEVDAGENRGRTLTHDFVVLDLATTSMQRQQDAYIAAVAAPAAIVEAPRNAIAVWVSTAASQAPLQAAGGWLGIDHGD